MPPESLPTLWNDNKWFISSCMSGSPGTTSPATTATWTRTATDAGRSFRITSEIGFVETTARMWPPFLAVLRVTTG
jgi:hypothetical protein